MRRYNPNARALAFGLRVSKGQRHARTRFFCVVIAFRLLFDFGILSRVFVLYARVYDTHMVVQWRIMAFDTFVRLLRFVQILTACYCLLHAIIPRFICDLNPRIELVGVRSFFLRRSRSRCNSFETMRTRLVLTFRISTRTHGRTCVSRTVATARYYYRQGVRIIYEKVC